MAARDAVFVEKRRVDLDSYLSGLLKNRELATSPCVAEFLSPDVMCGNALLMDDHIQQHESDTTLTSSSLVKSASQRPGSGDTQHPKHSTLATSSSSPTLQHTGSSSNPNTRGQLSTAAPSQQHLQPGSLSKSRLACDQPLSLGQSTPAAGHASTDHTKDKKAGSQGHAPSASTGTIQNSSPARLPSSPVLRPDLAVLSAIQPKLSSSLWVSTTSSEGGLSTIGAAPPAGVSEVAEWSLSPRSVVLLSGLGYVGIQDHNL